MALLADDCKGTLRLMAENAPPAVGVPPGDIQEARNLIASAMPIMARLAGLGPIQARSLLKIVLAEFDAFIVPALAAGRQPVLLQGSSLAGLAGVKRGTLDEKYRTVGPALQRCAMAFALLLDARGDFLERTVSMVEETSSRVGDKASGDGIPKALPEGRRFQRLYGIMLNGLRAHAHMTLVPPLRDATPASYAEDLVSDLRMLVEVTGLVHELGDLAQRTGNGQDLLDSFDLSPSQLCDYVPPSDLLVPILNVGRENSIPGKFQALSPQIDHLRRQLNATPQGHGIRRAVIQVPAQPFSRAQRKLDAAEVRRILGWLVNDVALDFRVRPADIRYGLEERTDLLLHRRVLRDEDGVETMLGLRSTFVLLGFRTTPERKILDEDLAHAIVGAELLASRTAALAAAMRLGEDLVPGFTQVKTAEARSFVRCLRLIANIALSVVSERRKREEEEAGED